MENLLLEAACISHNQGLLATEIDALYKLTIFYHEQQNDEKRDQSSRKYLDACKRKYFSRLNTQYD